MPVRVLFKNNYQVPLSDLFGTQGLNYLSWLSLPDYHKPKLDSHQTLYSQLVEQVSPLTHTIHQLAKKDPGAKLLMSIPGIGPFVAMTIVTVVEDISRFTYEVMSLCF